MKIVIFKGGGRLGNQIFQYCFLKNFAKERSILITFNFKEFKELFHYYDWIINISNSFIIQIYDRYIYKLLEILLKRKIIGYASVIRTDLDGNLAETSKYEFIKGFLPVILVGEGYFQSEKMFDVSIIKNIKIKDKYLEDARNFLTKNLHGKKTCFVHVRRGDYLKIEHRILGSQNYSLPLEYYKKAVNKVLARNNKICFVIMSDDYEYIKKNFSFIKNKVLSDQNMYIDFTIQTLCDAGIIANSSFSWWGGYLANCSNDEIVVPKNFLGFKNGFEYPRDILSCFTNRVDVS